MTNVTTAGTQPDTRTNGRKGVFVAGETEARPGMMSTEFWLTILSAMTVAIATYVSDSLSSDVGWALFAGIIAAYVVSRGLAKAGSREGPFILGDTAPRESQSA